MPKKRVTLDALTAAALEVADAEGFDTMALTGIARRLEVAASTLYTHTDGLDSLKHLVAVAATRNLTQTVQQAAIGRSGSDALMGMAVAYRKFALEHAGQFASTLLPPQPGDRELLEANVALRSVFETVYRAIGLDEDETRRAARATRSAIHGFLALERGTGLASEHDDDFDYLLTALQRGLLNTHTDDAERDARRGPGVDR